MLSTFATNTASLNTKARMRCSCPVSVDLLASRNRRMTAHWSVLMVQACRKKHCWQPAAEQLTLWQAASSMDRMAQHTGLPAVAG